MPQEKIKSALIRFQAAITKSDGPALSAALAELDGLLAEHRGRLDPQLEHFLEGRSYAKALAWLGEQGDFGRPATPPGGCRSRD